MKTESTVPEDVNEWERIIHSLIRWPENPSSKLDFLDLEILGKCLSEIISEDRGDRSIS
jgi:hypothetical protein